MQPFNLDEWLKDKSRKVVTRDGREVEIVKYDMKGTHFPILYVISNEDGSQEPCECSKSGMCLFDNTQSSTDLFFADEEEELTKFELRLLSSLDYTRKFRQDFSDADMTKIIKDIAEELLDLAKKEIRKEEPVSEDLEEEIDRFEEWLNSYNQQDYPTSYTVRDIAHHFAEWQKQKDQETIELAEDHAMLAGMNKMKEEMMKDAIEGWCINDGHILNDIRTLETEKANLKIGDEVKIIIVKTEQK